MTWKTQLEKALEQQAASRCDRVPQSEAGPVEDSLLCGVPFPEVASFTCAKHSLSFVILSELG